MTSDIQIEDLIEQMKASATSEMAGASAMVEDVGIAPGDLPPMKCGPLRKVHGDFIPCSVGEASHVELCTPGPFGYRIVPVAHRSKTGADLDDEIWDWNGDIYRPSFTTPFFISQWIGGEEVVCHSTVRDGLIHFHEHSTHEHAGFSCELLDVDQVAPDVPAPLPIKAHRRSTRPAHTMPAFGVDELWIARGTVTYAHTIEETL